MAGVQRHRRQDWTRLSPGKVKASDGSSPDASLRHCQKRGFVGAFGIAERGKRLSAGHVFISHGSNDRDEANALSDYIEARGIRTWIAPRDVRPGQDYSEQLQQAIETCTAFVVLVTEKANSSPYVRAETEMAFSTSKPIFPVRQSDIQPGPGLAFFLKIRHWTDAFGKQADAAMERLGLELEAVCGVEKPAPPPEPTAPPATAPAAPAPASPPASVAQPAPTTPPQPTAPPQSTAPLQPTSPPRPLGSDEEERQRAAIGPRADWYLEKWRRMEAGKTSLSWNWPAFLATFFWFAYRRMWLPLAVSVGLFLLTDFMVSRDPSLVALGWLFLLAIALAAGAFANALYRGQIRRLVARADGLDQPVALAQIGAQGGISVPGLATSLGIFFLLLIAAGVQQARMAANQLPANGAAQATQVNPPYQQGQVAQAPAQPATPAGPPPLDASYIVGRWTSDGNCNSSFNSDGSFNNEGNTGYWSLVGDRLTMTGTSTVVLQVVPADANNMTLIQADGSSIRATRC